jgi:hypothetical protein
MKVIGRCQGDFFEIVMRKYLKNVKKKYEKGIDRALNMGYIGF